MKLTSAAFDREGLIPSRYTCDGSNVSPALSFEEVPAGTASLALICDDPDAPFGTWVHWVYYDLPGDTAGLPEDVPLEKSPLPGGTQGANDFGQIGYGGPCPPGGTHRYFFKLYALDAMLDLPPGASKGQLLGRMKGHILAEAELMGSYGR
jgi:hypothetical protein